MTQKDYAEKALLMRKTAAAVTEILSHSELRARGIPYSKSQLWRLERAGKFPRRIRLGVKHYGYVASEIEAYIAACIATRDGTQHAA